jgi:hypothetical protein
MRKKGEKPMDITEAMQKRRDEITDFGPRFTRLWRGLPAVNVAGHFR